MKEINVKNLGRWCREKIAEELTAKFSNNPNLFITEFSRLKVNDLEGLRAELRNNFSTFLVVKNSIACLVLENLKINYLTQYIKGQTGVVVGGNDPVSISKVLVEFGRKFSEFKIAGGILNSQPVTLAQIKELSQLPGRPVLLAKVCSSLKSPISRLVYSLGLINKLALILKNKANKAGNI